MRVRSLSFASVLLLCASLNACGDNNDSDAGPDGEVQADTGTPPVPDSGPDPDSGPMPDGGPPPEDCTTDCEYVEVNVGALHVCGRRENGEVLCWGRNQESQLGDNRTRHDECAEVGSRPEDCSDTPENVRFLASSSARPRIEDATGLAIDGFSSSCAIREDGSLWCWSNETVPEAAGGMPEQRATAEQETDFSDVRAATASGSHLCVAEGATGAVRCMGRNGEGQLGGGFFEELIITPLQVLIGDYGAMPVLDAGMGDAGMGDAGMGDAGTDGGAADAGMDGGATDAGMMADGGFPTMPLVGALELSLGHSSTCARTADDVYCWGDNEDGQLGDGRLTVHRTCVDGADSTDCSPYAVVVGGTGEARLGTVSDLDVGSSHACAVRDGNVLCWGDNRLGQSGQVEQTQVAYIPTQVGDIDDAIQVAAGSTHTCALHSDGTISCWGANLRLQLGDGLTTHGQTCMSGSTSSDCSRTPVDVAVIDDATYLAANSATTCAIRENGSVWCWGYNTNRQLGDGTRENRSMPVMVMGTP